MKNPFFKKKNNIEINDILKCMGQKKSNNSNPRIRAETETGKTSTGTNSIKNTLITSIAGKIIKRQG